ncbi:hypothetical protein HPB50_014416 [Hyalomma asiaticum]|uniref:Uncharacterized protein n=1 Tax=Hyalomma asiaticum TaxID=266040 RepID=A0ACB7RI43_HYAAI|nr:hypothetical protein HPB50_014416 [Hyalomma asiaticum]
MGRSFMEFPIRCGRATRFFLSFDPNHLIKNLLTNFLEREILDGEQVIRGGFYLKKLFDIQSSLLLKPLRFLTRSHIEPANIEKMKVRRATQAMSPEIEDGIEQKAVRLPFRGNNTRSKNLAFKATDNFA